MTKTPKGDTPKYYQRQFKSTLNLLFFAIACFTLYSFAMYRLPDTNAYHSGGRVIIAMFITMLDVLIPTHLYIYWVVIVVGYIFVSSKSHKTAKFFYAAVVAVAYFFIRDHINRITMWLECVYLNRYHSCHPTPGIPIGLGMFVTGTMIACAQAIKLARSFRRLPKEEVATATVDMYDEDKQPTAPVAVPSAAAVEAADRTPEESK